MEEKTNDIIFLIKTMESKFLNDTLKKGRICFNHPTAFNKGENLQSAQLDRWDGYSAYTAIYTVFAPIIGKKENGFPIYGKPVEIKNPVTIHRQSDRSKNTPICCFREVRENDFETVSEDVYSFSLGDTVDRIRTEFGHDAFIMVKYPDILFQLNQFTYNYSRSVIYQDTLNDYDFGERKKYENILGEIFRKDSKYSWQKEFRITLFPTFCSRVFWEIGSIENITLLSGDIELLRHGFICSDYEEKLQAVIRNQNLR